MNWRQQVGQDIAMNMFLKSTTSFETLSKYVREEIEELQNDLKEFSNGSGTLVSKEINGETIEYLLPLVNRQEKGFQVHFNEGGGCIDIKSVDSARGTRVLPLISIEPKYAGAIVQDLDEQGAVTDEGSILPDTLDRVFEQILY